MQLLDDEYSQRLIDDTLQFGRQISGAVGSLFFWLEQDLEFTRADGLNVPDNFVHRYLMDMRPVDPLNTPSLSERNARVAMLHTDSAIGTEPWDTYVQYLADYGIGDELNMLFWSGQKPVAGLAVYRPIRSTPFADEMLNWESIQAHFEHSLQMHSRLRADKVRSLLSERYNLQPREIELTSILMRGASNAEIAQQMGIAIPTVKSHIVNILDKMGLHGRGEISACVSFLQFS